MSKNVSNKMLAEERRREIVSVLGLHGRVTVDEVAKRFGVSAVTARSDLDALSVSGALVRSHGGGIKPLTAAPEHPLKVREGMNHNEKVRIARAALSLIKPLQTVFLCSGSTSAELATQLKNDTPANTTVISYALNIAQILTDCSKLSLIMLGGFMRQPSTALVGPHAEHMMSSLHADHCFMSCVGLDSETGITTLDIMEAQLNHRMIQASTQVTVLADSSKFGHRSLSLIHDFRGLHRVITDTQAPARDVDRLRSRGLEVILV
jgi:DeoR family transcriptional regulator of aga operon